MTKPFRCTIHHSLFTIYLPLTVHSEWITDNAWKTVKGKRLIAKAACGSFA
jgi:hypothetical protein